MTEAIDLGTLLAGDCHGESIQTATRIPRDARAGQQRQVQAAHVPGAVDTRGRERGLARRISAVGLGIPHGLVAGGTAGGSPGG